MVFSDTYSGLDEGEMDKFYKEYVKEKYGMDMPI